MRQSSFCPLSRSSRTRSNPNRWHRHSSLCGNSRDAAGDPEAAGAVQEIDGGPVQRALAVRECAVAEDHSLDHNLSARVSRPSERGEYSSRKGSLGGGVRGTRTASMRIRDAVSPNQRRQGRPEPPDTREIENPADTTAMSECHQKFAKCCNESAKVRPRDENELTFNEMQSVFHNWMSYLACVTENGKEYIREYIGNGFLTCNESQNRSESWKLCLHLVQTRDLSFRGDRFVHARYRLIDTV
jgi:hypothetical protein